MIHYFDVRCGYCHQEIKFFYDDQSESNTFRDPNPVCGTFCAVGRDLTAITVKCPTCKYKLQYAVQLHYEYKISRLINYIESDEVKDRVERERKACGETQ